MTEISYIMQNGQQVNLKDAKGRALLAEKQTKLKAGNGISIAEDGTISAISGGSGSGLEVKELVVKDLTLGEYCGGNYVYDMTIKYIGNPALLSKQCKEIYSEEAFNHRYEENYNGNSWDDSPNIDFIGFEGSADSSAVLAAFEELEDTGENFLIVSRHGKCVITDRSFPEENLQNWGGEPYWCFEVGEEKEYYQGKNDFAFFVKAFSNKEQPENGLSDEKVFYCYTYNNAEDGANPAFVGPEFFLGMLGKV